MLQQHIASDLNRLSRHGDHQRSSQYMVRLTRTAVLLPLQSPTAAGRRLGVVALVATDSAFLRPNQKAPFWPCCVAATKASYAKANLGISICSNRSFVVVQRDCLGRIF